LTIAEVIQIHSCITHPKAGIRAAAKSEAPALGSLVLHLAQLQTKQLKNSVLTLPKAHCIANAFVDSSEICVN